VRLTDQQILSIFGRVIMQRDGPSFLKTYADCVCQASQADFLILRPASLILIAKYKLQPELTEITVHNFPARSA
jgi:hypothetical protein